MTAEESQRTLINEVKTKALQAQVGLWNTLTNTFGFLVAATSFVAGSAKSTGLLLLSLLIILVCFAGVICVIRCFRHQKALYTEMLPLVCGHQKPEDYAKKYDHGAEVVLCEKYALGLLTSAALAFIVLCVLA